MKQIRLLLAELMMNLALSLMPEGREQVLLARFLKSYASLMTQEYEQERKKKREDLRRTNALARKVRNKKLWRSNSAKGETTQKKSPFILAEKIVQIWLHFLKDR